MIVLVCHGGGTKGAIRGRAAATTAAAASAVVGAAASTGAASAGGGGVDGGRVGSSGGGDQCNMEAKLQQLGGAETTFLLLMMGREASGEPGAMSESKRILFLR